jgi:hypothetical protein
MNETQIISWIAQGQDVNIDVSLMIFRTSKDVIRSAF